MLSGFFTSHENRKCVLALRSVELASEEAVENVDCEAREDGPGDLNRQSIPAGQQFTATVPRLQKLIGINQVSDAVASKAQENNNSDNFFPNAVLVHGLLSVRIVALLHFECNGDLSPTNAPSKCHSSTQRRRDRCWVQVLFRSLPQTVASV